MSKIYGKPKVGQILYSLNVGNATRYSKQKLTPVKVLKVGRKYFYCAKEGLEFCPVKYEIDTWDEYSMYSAESILYKTEQEYEEKKEIKDICWFISDSFKYGNNLKKITLEKLRIIKEILND